MARLIQQQTYSTVRNFTFPSPARLALLAFQFAVLGGIGILLALAVVNSIFGAPTIVETPYAPYGAR